MKLHYCDGMSLHGDNACKYLDFERYNIKTDRRLPCLFWLYSRRDYQLMSQHRGQVFIYWHNTDVLYFLEKRKYYRYLSRLRSKYIYHGCTNDIIRNMLAEHGISATVIESFYGDVDKYKTTYKYNPRPQVWSMSAPGGGQKYGEPIVCAAARELPNMDFYIFGCRSTHIHPYNIHYFGWVKEDEMDNITKTFQILVRMNQMDGYPHTVVKAILRGQYAITRIPFNDQVPTAKNIDELIGCLMVSGGKSPNNVTLDLNNWNKLFKQ